jgi:hypothetical protein
MVVLYLLSIISSKHFPRYSSNRSLPAIMNLFLGVLLTLVKFSCSGMNVIVDCLLDNFFYLRATTGYEPRSVELLVELIFD